MASQQNFFALLDDDDENDDPMAVIARAASPTGPEKPPREAKKQQQPVSFVPQQQTPAKLPGKPLPPAQAVREAQQAQFERGRGRGVRGGRGGGRGVFFNQERDREGGFGRQGGQGSFQVDRGNDGDRNYRDNRENNGGGRGGFYEGGVGIPYYRDSPVEEREGVPPSFEGGRFRGRGRGRGRGYFYSGDDEERSRRREYDRRSGTGRGTEMRRNGFGRGNWGSETDQESLQELVEGAPTEEEKPLVESVKTQPEEETTAESANMEEKKLEEEDNEMTLEEYERLLIEKRRSLEALKPQIRKVTLDKDFESMQVVDKRHDDDVLQRGADVEKIKKKLTSEREEKSRRSVSINEFLKPADGEYYSPTGRRGRGRGRGGDRGGYRGGSGGGLNNMQQFLAPCIEDPGQFPTLSGK
eukprot:c26282_g1_i1 orf=172-1410(+)